MVIIILSLQYASLLKCITLASGSADKSIRLWNIITGQQIQILNSESSTIFSVHFSTDGSTLASGSMDNSINLWDVNTGKQKVKLDENYNCISAVCFSSDCSILACGSVDKSISLWDFKIGKEIICSDKSYQEILLQFKHLFFQIIHNQKSVNFQYYLVNTNFVVLLISQQPILQASCALILKIEFVNYQGLDLKQLLKSKGRCILENNSENSYKIDQNCILQ